MAVRSRVRGVSPAVARVALAGLIILPVVLANRRAKRHPTTGAG